MLLPMTPGASCATCEARRPLSGVSAICSARTVRPITEVSTSVVAASTCTTSLSAPDLQRDVDADVDAGVHPDVGLGDGT